MITRREAQEEGDDLAPVAVGRALLEGELEHSRQGEESFNSLLVDQLTGVLDDEPDAAVLALVTPEMEALGTFVDSRREHHPDRVWDMKVNEQHGVAFAAGLAKAGRRPIVVASTALFHRAHDQLVQEIGSRGLPVVFVLAYSGLVSSESTIDHGCGDLAVLRCIPGLDLMSPRDGREMEAMLRLALRQDGPSAIRIPHAFAPAADRAYPERAELGRGTHEVLRRGSDVAILGLGSIVYPLMDAAELLAEKGIEASVVNMRFARPVDQEFLAKMLEEHSLIFTAEEHRLAGGFGSAVLEIGARERLPADRIVPIALPNGPLSRGPRHELLARHGLDGPGLADRILHTYRKWVRS